MANVSEQLTTAFGGKENIVSIISCMTRLRVVVRNESNVDFEALKQVDKALGVVNAGGEIQVVFGPGVKKVASALSEYTGVEAGDYDEDQSLEDIASSTKNSVKGNQSKALQGFMTKFSNIFVPLIPGFIAAGMLAGLAALLNSIALNQFGEAKKIPQYITQTITYMQTFNKALLYFLPVLVGYNATKAYGGSGVTGAILGSLFLVVYAPVVGADGKITGATLITGTTNFYGISIDARGGVVSGGIIGVLITTILAGYVEKFVAKYTWDAISIFWPSLVTLLVMSALTFTLIMPLSGWLFQQMTILFKNLNSSPLGAAVLAGLFLIAVLFGIHQGFVPVYQGLVNEVGYNTLFPILAMAGAGQVGASLALLVKSKKDSKLGKMIKGAIIPGFLGIGEPLIYGVTLPRVKPFITACLGGAVGGFYIGALAASGIDFGLNTVFGPSGLLAVPLMTSSTVGVFGAMGLYLSALLVSYVSGFVLTYYFGTKGVDLD